MNFKTRKSANSYAGKALAIFLALIMVICMMPAEVNAATTSASAKTEDIAFFGIDKSNGDCDTVYVVHIDHSKKTAKIMSIYRDCYVKIKGKSGYKKIKWAYQYGGADLAVDTLNRNFDLKIKDYVSANFEGFSKFIDDLGGVEIKVSDAEAKAMKKMSAGISKAGTHKLNGDQALIYCRIRYDCGGDYARTERNRNMFKTVYAKAAKMSKTKKIALMTKTLDNADKNVDTSLSVSRIKTLLGYISTYKIESDTAYPNVFYSGDINELWSAVPYSLKDMSTSIHDYLYPGVSYKTSKNVNTYSTGLISLANKSMKNRVLEDKSGVKTKLTAYNAVKVSWSKVDKATSYKVYYKKFTNTKWTLKGSTTKTSMTVKSLAAGSSISFKVVPTWKKNGKTYTGPVKVCKPVSTLKKATLSSVKKASSGKVKVSWKKLDNVTGYQISKSTSKTKKSVAATITSAKTKSKVIKATKGKKYYYRIRAYKKVSGKKIYTPWSAAKSYKL